MFTSKSRTGIHAAGSANVLIPLIRTAATIGFAISPCSLGFVIIAVSEHLIRSIMVGDDTEVLLTDLQNQFPNANLKIDHDYSASLVASAVELIEHPDMPSDLPADVPGADFQSRVRDAVRVCRQCGRPRVDG